MKFKNARAELEFKFMPARLKDVAEDFETFSLYYGVEPTITRVREPVPGDSGVHEAGRGFDARDSQIMANGETIRAYTQDQADSIVTAINQRYPRKDGKPTAMHHSFAGGPAHLHFQIPAAWLDAGEPVTVPALDQG